MKYVELGLPLALCLSVLLLIRSALCCTQHTAMDLGSGSCRAMLKLDALQSFLKAASKNKSELIHNVNPFGFALTSDRGLVDTKECFIEDLSRSIHSYLSPEFCAALTDADMSTSEGPKPGTIVALAGRTAMPCVCEAPTTVSTDNGTKMVVEVRRLAF